LPKDARTRNFIGPISMRLPFFIMLFHC
jgi:hypothetical protein